MERIKNVIRIGGEPRRGLRGADWLSTGVYSVAHFAVDFACAYIMLSRLRDTGDWQLAMLVYNFCAFAMQLPLGIIADRLNRNASLAVLGALTAAVSMETGGIVLAALLGLGNGLFHVGAGVDVLNMSGEKAKALGVFVSPGAFGIYFGTITGKTGALSDWQVAAALVICAAVMLAVQLRLRRSMSSGNAPASFSGVGRGGALCCGLLFVVVCIRGFAGFSFNFPWRAGLGLVTVCAVVLGKAAGGFLADVIGARRSSAITLTLSAVLFLLADAPFAGLAAIFLFNMTMPVTLFAVARRFPQARGFSFGLLTLGLFIGFLPVYLGFNAGISACVTGFICAAVSVPLMLWGVGED